MSWISKNELASSLLVACPIVLLVLLFLVFFRWNDIKGSYLINEAALSQTTGTITESEIICKSGSKTGRTYHYAIRYRFRANERDYESEQVTFTHTGTSNKSFAEEYIRKYPVGNSVTVFYQETNPSFSVLEPESKDGGFLLSFPVFAGLTILVFIWALFAFFKS